MIHDTWRLADAVPDIPAIPIANATLRAIAIRRGIDDQESFRRFVAPSIGDLHDPAGIHGI
ncbi:MAG TPA: hypothetical protein VN181_10195, partial [Thermoanaerobaculia bacterium]|nr:hypothetical protein [Thermoanaerobaculia bacterium]